MTKPTDPGSRCMREVVGALKDADKAHSLGISDFYTSIAKRIIGQLDRAGMLANTDQ